METKFTFICILYSINCFSQTEQLELKSMSERYVNKEFNIETYKKMSASWTELINYYDGYPEFPLNENNGLVEFEFVQEYPNQSKQVIFDRIHEWAALTFGNISSVLHYENFENGKIILKGNFDVIHRGEVKLLFIGFKDVVMSRTCFQTYVFTIIENKVKIQIIDIKYEYKRYQTLTSGAYSSIDVKESLHSLYPITDARTELWKQRIDIIYQTKKKIEGISTSLEYYIKSVEADYKF